MRRLTLTLSAALFLIGAAVSPAMADHKHAREAKRGGTDRFTQKRLVAAVRERDHRLAKLDRAMEYEQRRARSKYRHDRRGLRAAYGRLKVWYASYDTRIRHDYRNARDRILADSRRNPRQRALAQARARRDRDLRDLAASERSELRRAHRKYRGRELRDARRRLSIYFARERAAVNARFERETGQTVGTRDRDRGRDRDRARSRRSR